MNTKASIPNLVTERTSPGVLLARVSGNWREALTLPSVGVIRETLSKEPSVKAVEFDTAGVSGWDSRFVAFINQCTQVFRGCDIELRYDGLPEGARRLLRLAHAVPEKSDTTGCRRARADCCACPRQCPKKWMRTAP